MYNCSTVDVPIIKEVGFGMSKELYKDLIDVGVTYVEWVVKVEQTCHN